MSALISCSVVASSALPAFRTSTTACQTSLRQQSALWGNPSLDHQFGPKRINPSSSSGPFLSQGLSKGLTMKASWFSMFGGAKASIQTSEGSAIAQGPDTDNPGAGLQFATFGAGCFWGVELAYQRVPGVVKTEVGYTQGQIDQPTYEAVCSGRTGHVEAVRVAYNPKEVSYEQLLDVLWQRHNPTTLNRQGGDVGTQYRSGIYYYTPEQEQVAKESIAKEEKRINKKIVTELLPARKWYPAESYHQQYLAKGGRFSMGQSAAKGCTDPIRCYG